MPGKPNTKKTQTGVTEKAGYAFVSNVMKPYTVSAVDAKKLFEMADNIYISGIINQTVNLVMSAGKVTISVYDEEDNVVEDVSRKLNTMFSRPGCSITECARAVMFDLIKMGSSLWNWIWERDAGELVCKELVHLDPFTFRDAPMGASNTRTYGHVLKGIYYDTADERIHYCQKAQNGSGVIELAPENLFVAKDTVANYPDGNCIMYPVIPLASFLDYCWNTLGQQMFRTGAPIMFITVKEPNPARMGADGKEIMGDIEYAENVLANWGKDTPYVLRENMAISSIEVKEGSLAVQAINKAAETIRDYMSPVGMLGRDGALIAGSSDAALRLVNNHIKGWTALLEENLRELPNYYLRHNAYPEGWHAEVNVPSTTVEDTTQKLNHAQLICTQKIGTVNEARELLGLEGISAEEMVQMADEWRLIGVNDVMAFATNSMSPNRSSYKKRSEIASKAEAEINQNTEDLLHSVLKVLRDADKANKTAK